MENELPSGDLRAHAENHSAHYGQIPGTSPGRNSEDYLSSELRASKRCVASIGIRITVKLHLSGSNANQTSSAACSKTDGPLSAISTRCNYLAERTFRRRSPALRSGKYFHRSSRGASLKSKRHPRLSPHRRWRSDTRLLTMPSGRSLSNEEAILY